jgi:ubiquinone/menaquinone biosynthesis C-methylase UbiE
VSPASEQYVIRGGQPGYERLTVLARSWRPTTAALFDRVQLGEGMRCLDLGCGSGDVTFEMAQRVGPDGSVTGVDMDEVKLGLAREAAAAQGLANVEFQQMNIYEWAEPDSYDLVYARFVLQHLSRPVDVLRSMWTGVRAGGVIVVEDADFEGSFCDPPHEGFAFWVEAYQRAASEEQVRAILASLAEFAADPVPSGARRGTSRPGRGARRLARCCASVPSSWVSKTWSARSRSGARRSTTYPVRARRQRPGPRSSRPPRPAPRSPSS